MNQCKGSLKFVDDIKLDAKNMLQESLAGKNVDYQLISISQI